MSLTRYAKLVFCLFIAHLSCAQNRLSPGSHFATVNGTTLHYYVTGKGPVMLFPTPGWGASMEYLKNYFHPFEQYFTMVYYDTRHSGQSKGPEDSKQYTTSFFMEDMDALRNYLNQPKVWLSGHSMGGFQVLSYGISHPNNVNGIVAIAALAGRDSLYEAEIQKAVLKRKDKPYFEAGAKVLMNYDPNMTLTQAMKFIIPFYFHDEKNIDAFIKKAGSFNDQVDKYTQEANFGTEYLFPKLSSINVPTFVVVGDDDFICDKISQSDRIAKQIPQSTEVIIKDAGHFPFVEQPQSFFLECSKWFEKQGIKKQK